jgi:hypothetical protein
MSGVGFHDVVWTPALHNPLESMSRSPSPCHATVSLSHRANLSRPPQPKRAPKTLPQSRTP